MKNFFIFLMLGLFGSLQAQDNLEPYPYPDTEVPLKGFFAYDKLLKSRRGGVLIIPEENSPEKFIKETASQLGTLGYVVFVPDLYAALPPAEEDDEEAAAARSVRFKELIQESLRILADQSRVDPNRMAAIGYGEGGRQVLELARAGTDLKAVINYFGSLKPEVVDESRRITTTVLVLLGADDPLIGNAEIQQFRQEMNATGADWQLNLYGGAVNSFTYYELGFDNSSGRAYNYNADKRAFEAVNILLHEKLK